MANKLYTMRVTLLLAHPQSAPSIRRMAQAMHRHLGLPSAIHYVSPRRLPVLHMPLPAVLKHVWYVLYTRRCLQRLASRLPRHELLHLVDHSEAFLLPAVQADLKVATCHDMIPLTENRLYQHHLSRQLGHWLYWLTMRDITCADGIIACSRATSQDVLRLLPVQAERVKVVYPGVDTAFFCPLSDELRSRKRQQLGFQAHEMVILHVGSNAPYKNIPGVLRTVASVRDSGRPVRWVKAGQPLPPSLQRLARALGIADCIQAEASVDDLRLRDLYQSCDVLVFPSLCEGFGLPVLEALACGTPAVIADVPALNEWAREVCPCAPPDDVKRLAEKVLQSAEASRSSTVRARLREFATQYDWRRMAKQVAEAYREWSG